MRNAALRQRAALRLAQELHLTQKCMELSGLSTAGGGQPSIEDMLCGGNPCLALVAGDEPGACGVVAKPMHDRSCSTRSAMAGLFGND